MITTYQVDYWIAKALESPKVQKALNGQTVDKIYVNKCGNIVNINFVTMEAKHA